MQPFLSILHIGLKRLKTHLQVNHFLTQAFRARFSITITTTGILAMGTVRKTRSGSQYLVYVSVFRYISTPWRERLREKIRDVTAVIRPTD